MISICFTHSNGRVVRHTCITCLPEFHVFWYLKKNYHIKKLNVYDPRFFSILNSLIYGYEQQCLICRYQHSIHSLLWINIVIGPFERTQTTIWKGTNYSYENQNYSWRIFIKVFSTPIKDRTQCYICFIALNFHEHLWSYMYNEHKACHMEGYTNYQYITNICTCVKSPHFGMICLFPKCNKNSNTRFRSWYMYWLPYIFLLVCYIYPVTFWNHSHAYVCFNLTTKMDFMFLNRYRFLKKKTYHCFGTKHRKWGKFYFFNLCLRING